MLPSLAKLHLSEERHPPPSVGVVGVVGDVRARSAAYELIEDDIFNSLNLVGAFAVYISVESTSIQDFVQRLSQCTSVWYRDMVSRSMQDGLERPGNGFVSQRLMRERATFDSLDPALRERLLSLFDPSTDAGRLALLHSDTRKQVAQANGEPLQISEYLRWLATNAKQGNSSMALSNIYQAWTDTGLGWPAHLIPNIAFDLSMRTDALLQSELSLASRGGTHFPHLIYRSDYSKELDPHHDQIPPVRMIELLREHVSSSDPSTLGWIKKHGLQMLMHVEGGRWHPPDDPTEESGATYIIGPMTPARLLRVFEIMQRNAHAYGIPVDYWNRTKGPYFLPYDKMLAGINRDLYAEEGGDRSFEPLRRIPLQVPSQYGQAPRLDSAVLVGFPVGWLHGAYSSNQRRRITLTMPFDVRANPPSADQSKLAQTMQWLRDVATLNQPTYASEQEVAALLGAQSRVLSRTKEVHQFADGKTHRNPAIATDMYRSDAAAQQLSLVPGWFHTVGPMSRTVEAYLRRMYSNTSAPPRPVLSSTSGRSQAGPSNAPLRPQPAPQTSDGRTSGRSSLHTNVAPRPPMPSRASRDAALPIVPATPIEPATRIDPALARVNAIPVILPINASTAAHLWQIPLTARQKEIVGALAAMQDPSVRCFNIREPWASLIVDGAKTIENRSASVALPRVGQVNRVDATVGEWVLIAASKSAVSTEYLNKARESFEHQYGVQEGQARYENFMQRYNHQWPKGAIVGAVKFDFVVSPTTSHEYIETMLNPGALSWYAGSPDVGWHVRECISFYPYYIPDFPGLLSIHRLDTKHPDVVARVQQCLQWISSS